MKERDEDSGLHDIRSMASSTKLRLSSRRVSTTPPVDDDILASSSAGWKAVALPEPAKMVSLPSLDELPPVEEVKKDRKSKKELKLERTSASKLASEAIAVETGPVSASISPAPVAKPAVAAQPDVAVTPIIGARFAQQQKKSKTGLYAMLGMGLAAAAGVGWYVSTQMGGEKAAPQIASNEGTADRAEAKPAPAASAGSAQAVAAAPTVEPITPPAAEPANDGDSAAVATGMAAGGTGTGAGNDEAKASDAGGSKRGKITVAGKKKEDKNEATEKVDAPKEVAKPVVKPTDKKAEGGEGEPSFDALLKEAGVQDKKPAKVVLEKKSLSGADIKKGMSSVGAKAQACYAGTQGTAAVKLTVAPDGTVTKVAVTGVFAGTPVGACVEAAVKGATFPAWDGGPQSFGYSYLLAE